MKKANFLIDDAQSAAAASSEKERAMREQYAEVSANAAALQTQVSMFFVLLLY